MRIDSGTIASGSLLPPVPSVDDSLGIDRDEVPVDAFASIGEVAIEAIDCEGFDSVRCRR